MPTPTKGPRLGGGPAHERLLIAGLARALFTHGRIRTTLPKAKRLRPQAEHLITLAKRGDVASRRQVQTVLRDTTWRKPVLHSLFNEIAPRFADRPGGYTRILKLGPRPGDGAPMAIIELVDRDTATVEPEEEAGGRRRFGRRRRTPSAPPEGANRAQRRAAARGRLAEPHTHTHDEDETEDEAAEAAEAPDAEDREQLPDVPTDEELAAAEAAEAEEGVAEEAPATAEGDTDAQDAAETGGDTADAAETDDDDRRGSAGDNEPGKP